MNNFNAPIVLSNEMENEINVYASKVTPELPKLVDNEQTTVYVPVAGVNYPGISFFNPQHFSITVSGLVSLLKGGIEKIEKDHSDGLTDVYAIYLTDGRIEYFSIRNGRTPYIQNGYWYIDGESLGIKAEGPVGPPGPPGLQGPKGDGLNFKKIYGSVAEMHAGFVSDDVPIGGMVLINTDNVDDQDNSKIFVKREDSYHYVNDLSGATGIQGPQGIQGPRGPQGLQGLQGPQGPQGLQGPVGPKPELGVDYFTEDDEKRIVNKVIEQIPFAEEVSV